MARRSSRHGLSKKELEKQANESFSSTDDEEKLDKELFADVDGDNQVDKDVHYDSSELNASSDSFSDEPEYIPPSPQTGRVPKRKKQNKNDDSTPKRRSTLKMSECGVLMKVPRKLNLTATGIDLEDSATINKASVAFAPESDSEIELIPDLDDNPNDEDIEIISTTNTLVENLNQDQTISTDPVVVSRGPIVHAKQNKSKETIPKANTTRTRNEIELGVKLDIIKMHENGAKN